MTTNSTPAPRGRKQSPPKKPRPDFPLGIHRGSGYWCKKIKGRVYYFGKVADDPKGKAALELWLDSKDDLLAGREPRLKTADVLVVGELCNKFLTHHEQRKSNGELTPGSFNDYFNACESIVAIFGRNRAVSDIQPDDFRRLRAKLEKGHALVMLANDIGRVRSIFKFAYEEGLIVAPIRYGQAFKKPKKERIDAAREKKREKHGLQMFEAPFPHFWRSISGN